MNSNKTIFRLLLPLIIMMNSFVGATATHESCGNLINIEIKSNPINFTNELFTVTEGNLKNTIDKANRKIDRRDAVIDPKMSVSIMSRLKGINLLRLAGSDVNCAIAVDNTRDRLLIIDSENEITEGFDICGPRVRKKKGFPWFKITWECSPLWEYTFSKLHTFGSSGAGDGYFSSPVNIASCAGKETDDPYDLWIPDYRNNRIVHLRYTTSGNVEWVNTIGGFNQPIDIACRFDEETPTLYIAEELSGVITRIPFTDVNYDNTIQLDGTIQEGGISIGKSGGFRRPTGVCLNRSGDRDGWVNSITCVYVADAGNEEIYQFLDLGMKLQYMKSVKLPSLDRERSHLGIRSDRFGTLYVFDRDAGKVRVYSPNLEPLYTFGNPGDHSKTDINFNGPFTGFITGDNLYVTDKWGRNSGIQRFVIDGIDIISATVDYSNKMLNLVADNAFVKCTYSIDGGTAKIVDGLQYSGTFPLGIEDDLSSLSDGDHTLTVTVQSAFNPSETCTKTIGFIVDPEADRQPRNIEISDVGRRVDISWEAPYITTGLSGYGVYVDGVRVFDCNADVTSYSYYASRDDYGKTFDIKLGAIYEQPVAFSNVTNFEVDGSSIEHVTGVNASANAVQILTEADWDAMTNGTAWITSFTFDTDPESMVESPLVSVNNTPVSVVFNPSSDGGPSYVFSGTGIYEETANIGDRVNLILVKTGPMEFTYKYLITGSDGSVEWSTIRNETITAFPLTVVYESSSPGVKLTDCAIGLENAMSSSIPITLRSAGDVYVNGNDITLDEAVTTAFNGDNVLLSDARYTLSVPLNHKPKNDYNNNTPVSYTISLNSEVDPDKHAVISYTSSDDLIKTDRYPENTIDVDIDISGVILKSENPLTVIKGWWRIDNCKFNFSMENSIINAPELNLVYEEEDQFIFPDGADDEINISINSSTLLMDETDGFVTLDGFENLSLTMTDNLIYKTNASCYCFTNVDLCSAPFNAAITDNTFLIASECGSCESICSPAQNEIVAPVTDFVYLNSDYSVTNINNPGVIIDGATGEVQEIRGAVKTIGGVEIADITEPKLNFWPNLFERSHSAATIDKCMYLPVTDRSRVNMSMDSKGTIFSSDDIAFAATTSYQMAGINNHWEKEVTSGTIFYAYGENTYGLHTKKYAVSFPGRTIFDEQDIGNFFGADPSSVDVFAGLTSNDAASGAISWKVESLPIGGNPANGYETERTESLYEPLPDVTSYEVLSFYYKKQYTDQEFSITFEDDNNVTHTIQNTTLPTGTRGWELTTDAATTNWQQAVVLLQDEDNLPTGEVPMSGKLMRMTIHHQSASAGSSVPAWMLFDDISFTPVAHVLFDEEDPADFIGTGGSDGWDGLTSTDGFQGGKSFQVLIKTGNSSTSDEWTGFMAGPPQIDLPISFGKRKVTFAYKKSDPNSYVSLKLHMMDLETNAVTVFEISEQDNAEDITAVGWPIPRQNDTRWHQVFINLASARGPGNTDRAAGSPMPFGKCAKIELCLDGVEGAECLYDNIKFVQEYYQQYISDDEQYSVSADYFEEGSISGWKINALGEVERNTIISYGSSNNISFQMHYNDEDDHAANASIQNHLEVEKQVTVTAAEFPTAHIYWQEQGTPVSYIKLGILCTDGNTYPLVFSATGYYLANAKGVYNLKLRSDQSLTKHSYSLVEAFGRGYPELVNAATPITPVSMSGMKVLYQANRDIDWYTAFDYPSIEFLQQDATPLAITINEPVDQEGYGNSIPVDITANKEIKRVNVYAKNGDVIVGEWEISVETNGLTTVTSSCDLSVLTNSQLGVNGQITAQFVVTDIYDETASEELTIYVDWTKPTIQLQQPINMAGYNGIIPLEGFSTIELNTLSYKVLDEGGVTIIDDFFDYSGSGGVANFQESIPVDDAYRAQNLTVQIYGTSTNGMHSPVVARTIIMNPLTSTITIGTVNNPSITWNTIQTQATLCGASMGAGGTSDNLVFSSSQIVGNFEATLGVQDMTPSMTSVQAGLMARGEYDEDAVSDFIYLSSDGGYVQYRSTAGQSAVQNTVLAAPGGTVWLKLKRIGTTLTYYTSTDGSVFTEAYSRTIGTLPVYVGPAYTSGDAATDGCATFSDISIKLLPETTADIVLGVSTATRVLPHIVQDGAVASIEDLSTRNGGETITISGVPYTTGIGCMPQSNGAPAYLIYDLQSEASRLQVEQFVRLTGMGSTQDGATNVMMKIRAANTDKMPSLSEWFSTDGDVYIMWEKPAYTNPKGIDIDLTGVKWLGIFTAAYPMYSTRHGVWGDLKMEYIGSEHKAPVITSDPQSITRLVGEHAVFSVVADGTLPLEYQWQKNHMSIPGATSPAYMTSPVDLSYNNAVYRCIVTNDFGTDYSFDAVLTVVDENAEYVSEFAVVADEYLDIRNDVSIAASTVLSNTNLAIGNDANVAADVLAAGNIAVGDRTEVQGDVFAGGGVTLGSDAVVTVGTVAGGQSISTVDIQSRTVSIGSVDKTIPDNGNDVVSPGDYRDFHAFSNSTVRFGPGTYNFRKFILETNVSLLFELDGAEEAIINIFEETRFGNETDMDVDGSSSMYAVQWYSNYTQEIPIYPDSRFIGQLVAPNGSVHIYSRSLLNGLCHANQVVIEPEASVNYSRTISSTNQQPVFSVAAAAAANPVLASSVALSCMAIDDGGEENLLYHWSALSVPEGAWVNFSGNNSNDTKNITVTFSAPGTYTLQVTAEDYFLARATSTVDVTVEQVSSFIDISPVQPTVKASASQQFTATGLDQFGIDMVNQPDIAWSVNGGGTVDNSGLFIAGTTPGYFIVTATDGSVSGSAVITVTPDPAYQSNCGGGTIGSYIADQYFSGGTVHTVTSTINVSDVTSPAPEGVYKSERYGSSVYTIPGLVTSGEYYVRLHFAELYWPGVGYRKFNVTINGTQVLSYFDIFAATGARYKAIVKEFSVSADGSGEIDIEFTTIQDNASICGIEIIPAIQNNPPSITTAASATPNPVASTSTDLEVLGDDDYGEANLMYVWSTTGTPPAPVTFSLNGTNSAKNTTALFTETGSYALQVTVKDAGGLESTSSLTVAVDQTLTGIIISPSGASIMISSTQQFTASGYDQFGAPLTTQPTFSWNIDEGGTVDGDGLFTAGATAGGPFTLTVESGASSNSAEIIIRPEPLMQINCGGGAAAPYGTDQYQSGGTARTVGDSIVVSGISNPAPEGVYQSERYGTSTYTIPGLIADAHYTVRFHFAEQYWTSANKRKFNVAINGNNVLSNYDIYAATGARYKAVVHEFDATADESGEIVLQFNTLLDNATISGIEIY